MCPDDGAVQTVSEPRTAQPEVDAAPAGPWGPALVEHLVSVRVGSRNGYVYFGRHDMRYGIVVDNPSRDWVSSTCRTSSMDTSSPHHLVKRGTLN